MGCARVRGHFRIGSVINLQCRIIVSQCICCLATVAAEEIGDDGIAGWDGIDDSQG